MKPLVKFACSVCGLDQFTKLRDHRLETLGLYVSVCKNCGVVCLNPRMNDQDYADYYTTEYYGQYQPHPKRQPSPTSGSDRAIQIGNDLQPWLQNSTRVLEVGCGPGGNLIELKNRGITELTGLEPSVECSEILQSHGIQCLNGVLSDVDILDTAGPFDVLILSHMLEHFVDPASALRRIRNLLADDGLLYILVPNIYDGDYRRQFTVPHTFYFSPNTLQFLLYNSGFAIQQQFTDRSPEIALLASKRNLDDEDKVQVSESEYKTAQIFLQGYSLKHNITYVVRMIEWRISRLIKLATPGFVYRFLRDHYHKQPIG